MQINHTNQTIQTNATNQTNQTEHLTLDTEKNSFYVTYITVKKVSICYF